jgi:hypothetical protein
MSKIMRLCVLVVSLMSLFGVMSSAAGAVTWSNDGGHAFTATAGPGTLSGGGLSLACTGGTATGTMAASPFVGAIWDAATGAVTFNACTIAGVPTTVNCSYTLTATGQSTPAVTNGLLDVTCNVVQGGTKICHIEGSTAAHYINHPDPRLTVTTSNTLKTTNAVGSCPLGNNGTTHLSEFTFTMTSATPPTITRRP